VAFFDDFAMKYEIEIKDEAKIELRKLPDDVRREIGYRLCVGDHRVLFELVGRRILVYTLGQRKDIYR
jgi:mRNA-degrading endonuclease RelE of RelBE toxin-antitoxin system